MFFHVPQAKPKASDRFRIKLTMGQYAIYDLWFGAYTTHRPRPYHEAEDICQQLNGSPSKHQTLKCLPDMAFAS